MKKLLAKSTLIALGLGVAVIFGFFYLYKSSAPELASTYTKCPEDYAEDDAGTAEYRNVLIDWTSSFIEANPGATMSDWSIAKSQLWLDNNCVEALQRLKMSGEVADLKPWERVDYEVQNALEKAMDLPS